ncbi:hypothetical protein TWF694_004828 [Orbilia ellipsospora]|uniref:Histone H1 n=1 Tax=Orbilia ellipsospora TaxID=2528407 RepID=A0AAV9WUT5_9PEZI
MPPKKSTGTTTKKAATPADHPPYKDMIKDAIIVLKERNGSSRQAIKKYVLNNNKGIKESNFDTQFNAAIKRGVLAGDFVQPKGPSGPVKLQKKDAAKAATKVTTDKPAKKAVTKKVAAPKKAAVAKATKPKAAAKPKPAAANSKKPRKTTTATEKSSVSKTKTGRVTKAKAPTAKKATASKKAAPKKKAAEPAATASE